MAAPAELLLKLQDSLLSATQDRERVEVGPFIALLHRHEPLIYLNYAIPFGTATSEDLDQLEKAFYERERSPRFEYFPDLWPELEPMLIHRGYELEMRAPLMAMTNEEFIAVETSPAKLIDNIDELRQHAACGAAAFGMEGFGEAHLQQSLKGIESGRLRAAAIFEGQAAVACGCTVGTSETVELAGIGTRPEHRRKGLALRVSSLLCARHFDAGGKIVWLSAGDDTAKALYASLGFQEIGAQLNYSLPHAKPGS